MTSLTQLKIGSYHVSRVLGEGSYAVVVLAQHELTHDQVVLKLASKRAPTPAGAPAPTVESEKKRQTHIRRRFYRELSLMEELSRGGEHPNVIQLVDWLETPDFFVLVLEYMDGAMDLFRLIEQVWNAPGGAAVFQRVVFPIFYQILNGLQFCHSRNVAHRDVKLENILVNPYTGVVRVLDFGISALMQPGELLDTFCGSPQYTAPEVFLKQKYDGRVSDTWSLGVVLFAISSGRFPFQGQTVADLKTLVCQAQFELPAHFSPSLNDLVLRMLHPSPAKRITLEQIKKHPWWIHNCAAYQLDPFGASIRPLKTPTPVAQIQRHEPALPPALALRENCYALCPPTPCAPAVADTPKTQVAPTEAPSFGSQMPSAWRNTAKTAQQQPTRARPVVRSQPHVSLQGLVADLVGATADRISSEEEGSLSDGASGSSLTASSAAYHPPQATTWMQAMLDAPAIATPLVSKQMMMALVQDFVRQAIPRT